MTKLDKTYHFRILFHHKIKMASIKDLPEEILREIFIKNRLTITDARNLYDIWKDVDEIFAEKIRRGIINPFIAAQFDYHLKFIETGNLFENPDTLVPYSKRIIKRKY